MPARPLPLPLPRRFEDIFHLKPDDTGGRSEHSPQVDRAGNAAAAPLRCAEPQNADDVRPRTDRLARCPGALLKYVMMMSSGSARATCWRAGDRTAASPPTSWSGGLSSRNKVSPGRAVLQRPRALLGNNYNCVPS
jgi:hypothetical protein